MRSRSTRRGAFKGAIAALLFMLGSGVPANAVPLPHTYNHVLVSASAWYFWESVWHLGQKGSLYIVAGFVNVEGESDEIPMTYGTEEVYLAGSMASPCGPVYVNGHYPAVVTTDAATGVAHVTVTGMRSASCAPEGSLVGFTFSAEWVSVGVDYDVTCCTSSGSNKVHLTRASTSAGAWKWHGIPLGETMPEEVVTNAAQVNFHLEVNPDEWTPGD